MRTIVLLLLSASVCYPQAPRAQTQPRAAFYVAVDGDDAWSGSLSAPNEMRTDGPFKTLGRARDAIRQPREKPQSDLTVMVRGGTHFLPDTLVLTSEDSGARQRPVCYLAYPGEKPVLSGGRPITDWKRVDMAFTWPHFLT